MKKITFIWAEDLNEENTQKLKEKVDQALMDTTNVIITNFPIEFVQVEIPDTGDTSEKLSSCCEEKRSTVSETKTQQVVIVTKNEDLSR